MSEVTLAELCIAAASEAWRGNGELLASGIGVVPRLAAGLAKLTHSPELLMTDSEAYLVSEPVPLGARGDYKPKIEGYLSFERVFECVWSGKRHAMVGPTQIDRYGQTNISAIGDYAKPKSAILGARGFPGNTINHINSMFVPNHGPRVFVSDEVDMVAGVGYNAKRWPKDARRDYVDLRLIVTDLCVMDFGGPGKWDGASIRVTSLHPGVSFEQAQAATGFPLLKAPDLRDTAMPTKEQLAIIQRLDPHNLRATVIKNNPPAVKPAAAA